MRIVASALALCLIASSLSAASVSGTVVDSAGAKVAGITVHLLSQDARYEAVSGDAGAFRVSDVRAATYQVLLVRDSSFFSQTSIRISDDQDLAVLLKLKLPLNGNASAAVTGLLHDQQDKPVANARIDLIHGPGASLSMMTDASGRFAFEHVIPGQYKLRALATGGVVTYFPDVVDEDKAQLLNVRDKTDVDFRLQSTPFRKISGKIRDEDYQPVANARVRLIPVLWQEESLVDATLDSHFLITTRGDHLGLEEASVQTNENGEFVLAARSGKWRIQADGDKFAGGASLRVDSKDIEDFEVRVTHQPITGKLQWSVSCVRGRLTCGPKTGAGVLVPLRIRSGESVSNAVGITQPDGSFSAFAPHEYESEVAALPPVSDSKPVSGIAPPQNRARKGLPLDVSFLIRTAGGGDVLLDEDHPVDRDLPDLAAAMSGSIRGRVEKGSDCAVVLLPETTTSFGVLAPCQPDGRFAATGISPGNYTAVAIRSLTIENLRAFGLLAFIRKAGTKVAVRDSMAAEADLKVIDWPE